MRICISSFVRPPLPKEVYRNKSAIHKRKGEYKDVISAANKGFYGTGSIFRAIQRVEKVSEEILNK